MLPTNEEQYISFAEIAARWASEKEYSASHISYEMINYALCCGFQFEVDDKILPHIDTVKIIIEDNIYYEHGLYDAKGNPLFTDNVYDWVFNQFAFYLYNIPLPENPIEDCSDKPPLSKSQRIKINGLINRNTQDQDIIDNVYAKIARELYTTKKSFFRSLRVSQTLGGKAANELSMPKVFGDIWAGFPIDWMSRIEGNANKSGLSLKDAVKRFTDQDAWLYFEKRTTTKEKIEIEHHMHEQFIRNLSENRLYIKAYEEPVKPETTVIKIPSEKICLMKFNFANSTATIGQSQIKLSGIRVFLNQENIKKEPKKGRPSNNEDIRKEYLRRIENGLCYKHSNHTKVAQELLQWIENNIDNPKSKYSVKSITNIMSEVRKSLESKQRNN